MMREMPKIPAPRAYLDGLDIDDPATGHHYADMLEAKILEEVRGLGTGIHRRAGRRRIHRRTAATSRLYVTH